MGLFDAFQRKTCDICGQKVGLLGGTKLKDGRLDKDCAAKLSHYMSDLRGFTVEEIKQHLAYREVNNEEVKNFEITHILNTKGVKVYFNMDSRKLIISSYDNWRSSNPDILSFDQIVATDMNISENKREIMKKTEDGKQESYNPKRYEYSYNFHVTVNVNSPWFNSINIKVNSRTVDNYESDDYEDFYLSSEALCEVLGMLKDSTTEEIIETVNEYNNIIAQPHSTYEASYYNRRRATKRGYKYYMDRDPRRNHYKY